ncbi:hypothetical protein P691DRAFT_807989 [Macrolepiota fuliginosa MF-IS2]|uniref:STAS domain-containing protein n=1 Tax=Macrolepiota fuliginosa MF-IS2 TaxID=1400762 RepID=A0A9P5X3A6_9AGAR|nr:hypothetical protein P691DRAFT_807989 [Macrolepiota fuliginosa MF-IS2]
MDAVKIHSARIVKNAPGRLYRALPAVVLGTMFNVLDAVSTGLLLFPAEDGSGPTQFRDLQIQGLSMYIMSTILSQVAMTLGGSRFPGALGAMLIEILPFLRGVGSDIRNALGADNPALVPTVMAAYALTSFLTGFVFVMLGLLRLGGVVAYFPQTVLTGAIGAIGLSLFILGLGLPLPEASPPLTLSSAGSVLFGKSHLPILAASFLPPFILSVTKRSKHVDRWTRGAVHNAYYVPAYLVAIPLIFWIVAAAKKVPQEVLITNGWLFRVQTPADQRGIGTQWIYWREFNFSRVEWWALRHAITNIVLLVVIGVLNLPIYVPALGFTLDVPYNMNHEFLGQGVANLLAGVAGTVPNILQYSYSVFITRAHGGRIECAIVTILTFVLFLTASLLLPYVPTVLASALVLFLGIELMLEAVWESAQSLILLEWCIVIGTLLSCTFLGFAEGFGVGIGAAAVVYLVFGVVDSRARAVRWEEWNETQKFQRHGDDSPVPKLISPLNHTPSISDSDIETPSLGQTQASINGAQVDRVNVRVIVLTGYVFFASIPSLEAQLLDKKRHTPFIIADLATVYRLETSAAQCFDRAVRDLTPRNTTIVFCGVRKGSGVHADFERAGVNILFGADQSNESGIITFQTRAEAVEWCRFQQAEKNTIPEEPNTELDLSRNYEQFCQLFGFSATVLDGETTTIERDASTLKEIPTELDADKFWRAGAKLVHYPPGHTIFTTDGCDDRFVFMIEGQAKVMSQTETLHRPALYSLMLKLPKETFIYIRSEIVGYWRNSKMRRRLGAGDAISNKGLGGQEVYVVAHSRSSVIELQRGRAAQVLFEWARTRARS